MNDNDEIFQKYLRRRVSEAMINSAFTGKSESFVIEDLRYTVDGKMQITAEVLSPEEIAEELNKPFDPPMLRGDT